MRAPTEALEAVIRAEDTLTLEVRYRGQTVVRTSALGLEIDGHLRANSLPRETGAARRTVNETIRPVVAEKRAVIPDRYNELRLSFGPKLIATFRAYDDGVAYRFATAIDGEVVVRNEGAGLRLAKDDSIWIALVNCRSEPGVDCFQSSYEENYQQLAADAVPDARLAYLPITVQTAGAYVGFTESDLRDYPGLWL
ncbi:MAG TPA: glycoside hydrolase family 97 N-terminal domain-containing protein, partial [Steroidobacteraceae bacterium]|nr:glycoside hydrolase family 97 N-terminal domain-containing protein [Steroidobacteraceae bacterium]